MIEFTKLSWEAVEVGVTFQSNDLLIKPEDVETFIWAVDDHNPWFVDDSPFGGPICPPTLLGNQALMMRHNRFIVEAGLHAKMHFEFLAPLRVGMRVRSRGRVIDKYERRGRHYMVTEFDTSEEDTGEVLVRGQFTQMIFPASGVHDAKH